MTITHTASQKKSLATHSQALGLSLGKGRRGKICHHLSEQRRMAARTIRLLLFQGHHFVPYEQLMRKWKTQYRDDFSTMSI